MLLRAGTVPIECLGVQIGVAGYGVDSCGRDSDALRRTGGVRKHFPDVAVLRSKTLPIIRSNAAEHPGAHNPQKLVGGMKCDQAFLVLPHELEIVAICYPSAHCLGGFCEIPQYIVPLNENTNRGAVQYNERTRGVLS